MRDDHDVRTTTKGKQPDDENGDESSEKNENTESGSLLGRKEIRVRAPMKEHNKENERG
jgi:hypothetical protein